MSPEVQVQVQKPVYEDVAWCDHCRSVGLDPYKLPAFVPVSTVALITGYKVSTLCQYAKGPSYKIHGEEIIVKVPFPFKKCANGTTVVSLVHLKAWFDTVRTSNNLV